MAQAWAGVWRHRWEYLIGILVWALIAAGFGLAAGGYTTEVWKRILTVDEWLVAVVWLPWFIMMFLGAMTRASLKSQWALSVHDWIVRFSAGALTLFLLDLGTRAVQGLGWASF